MTDLLLAILEFSLGVATLYYAWTKLASRKRSESAIDK